MLNGRPMNRAPAPPSRTAGAMVRRLIKDYVREQWLLLAGGIAFMLFAAVMQGALPQLIAQTVKDIFLRHLSSQLIPLSLAAVIILWARAAGLFLGRAIIDSLGEKTAASAQGDMFESLVWRDLADLNAMHSGQFVSNFLYDATLMRDALTNGLAAIFLEFSSLIIFLAYVMITDWQLGLLALLALPGVAWAMERLGKSMRKAATMGMEETGDLSVMLAEAMDGRRIIKAYGLEDHAIARVTARLTTRLKTLLGVVRLRAAAAPMTDIFSGLVIGMVLLVAGWQNLHGELSLNAFTGFLAALLLALQPVRNISQYWPIASVGLAATSRIFDVIDTRPSIADKPGAKPLKIARAANHQGGGAVSFRAASFGYRGADGQTLEGVDLEVPAGAKVALVGPSGAGKTTIFNLLLRFYDLDGGAILIDGQRIHDVTLQSLRAAIAVVTQDAILFDESVAANIALGKPGATRAEIETAARNAAAHDFIADMPQGYETMVGEGGLKLSGGQRQRIAIARAMLRNAPILLLDEATSALDSESERQVQESLTRLMAGRTTIVIAHRLSTVRDADRIFVLDKGRIAQSGSHDALLAQGGLYAQLYRHNLAEPEPYMGKS